VEMFDVKEIIGKATWSLDIKMFVGRRWDQNVENDLRTDCLSFWKKNELISGSILVFMYSGTTNLSIQ